MAFLNIREGVGGAITQGKRKFTVSISGTKSVRDDAKKRIEQFLQQCSSSTPWNCKRCNGRCHPDTTTFALRQPYDRPHYTASQDCDPYSDIHEGNFHVSLLSTLAKDQWKLIAYEKNPAKEWTFQRIAEGKFWQQ